MRTQLWPDEPDEHSRTVNAYFLGEARFVDQVYVCESESSGTASSNIVGFIELRIRNYAEGSEQDRVPYIEGWYVEESFRKEGLGELLVKRAEDWARAQGFSELASDAEIENHGSIAAHLSLGFDEVERSVSFLKQL